jgi:hypothetical protein
MAIDNLKKHLILVHLICKISFLAIYIARKRKSIYKKIKWANFYLEAVVFFFFLFFSKLIFSYCSNSDDQPQEDLAKFGYKRQIKK